MFVGIFYFYCMNEAKVPYSYYYQRRNAKTEVVDISPTLTVFKRERKT